MVMRERPPTSDLRTSMTWRSVEVAKTTVGDMCTRVGGANCQYNSKCLMGDQVCVRVKGTCKAV